MEKQSSTRKLLENLNASTFATPLSKNDDELERSRRRSFVANSTAAATKDSPILTNALHLNQKQLLDALNKIQKMYAENKITKRNAWELHVVEYMRRYVGMQSNAGNIDMLRFASSTLDVSSKVYGLRVDSVYDTSMKLVSRINRMYAQGDISSAADAHDNDAENGEHSETPPNIKNKKKPKRRAPKSTICKDDAELFGNFTQIETGLFNTQTHIKNSMVENLFSSRLPLSKSGTTMKLMNEECAFRRDSDIDRLVNEPLVNKMFEINLPSKHLPPICLELQKFVIDEWDPDQAEVSQRTLEDIIYDKEGFPVAELDASLNICDNDNFENGGGIYNDSEDEDVEAQIITDEMAHNRVVAYVVDFHPNDSNMMQVNEYSYIGNAGNANRQLSQIWAGPSHWKLKTLKRSVARFTGKPEDKIDKNKRAKRPKRDEEIIIFDENISDVLPYKQCKKHKNTRYFNKEKFFMPLMKPERIMLNRLLTKLAFVKNKDQQKNDEADHSVHLDDNVDDGLGEYDHNNLNNSQYCPQDLIAEQDVVEHTDNCANFLENNLVDKPDMVAQSQLSYQTHAKKIDMRKLKNAIWACLTNTGVNQVAEKMTESLNYKDLLKQVPPKLSTQSRGDLTCQTVFVALLHLCNEHCLELDSSEDTDIVIRQG